MPQSPRPSLPPRRMDPLDPQVGLAPNIPIGLWLLMALDLYRDMFPPIQEEPDQFEPRPSRPTGGEGEPWPTEYNFDQPEDVYTG